jgi:hypothetical protein
MGGGRLRADGPPTDLSRLTLSVRIDKNSALTPAQALSKFRSKLMARDNFGVLSGKLFRQQTADVPPEPVVASQRIAVTNDESSGQ